MQVQTHEKPRRRPRPGANGKANGAAAPHSVQQEKKIAIFGTTPSRMEGPVQDDSGWKRWTIGPGGKDAHGWERLFEVHSWWPEDFKGYLGELSKEKRAVYTLEPMPVLMEKWRQQHKKSAEDYKKEIPGEWKSNVVVDRHYYENKYGRTWFSSSISWLMAMAIEEGATDIGLWGIDLESGEEYIHQYLGCRHFIDICRLVGINVHLPAGCALLREPRPYPDRYETTFALHTEKKLKWLSQMIGQMEGQYEGRKGDLHRAEGWLLSMRAMGQPVEEIRKKEQELISINVEVGQLAANINRIKGEQSSVEYFRRMYVYEYRDPDTPAI